jgi:hypothetical protein
LADIPAAQHGTTYGYRKGCRCEACRAAKKLDWQEYKARQATQDDGDMDRMGEPDQVAAILEDLVLRIRCDCGQWHEASPDFQCPLGAIPPDFEDPAVQ